jgi:3',5'-cyclic AMP phosphodiesterase CpdA
MSSARVVVVSDTHLSPALPEAAANWEAVVADLAADPPAAVVHAGDISGDGASYPEDLDFAAPRLAAAPQPVRAVPGNHDVGDNPHAYDPPALVDAERLARYRGLFGWDRWAFDVGQWTVLGLNAQLVGSGLEDEDEQAAWFTGALATAGRARRHVAVVVHKPLAPPPLRPGDVNPGRYLPAGRQRELLGAALSSGQARALVTGHTHQFGEHRRLGVTHVWAPSTWATLPESMQPLLGERACGVVDLHLHDDGGVTAARRVPPGLVPHVIGEDTSTHR